MLNTIRLANLNIQYQLPRIKPEISMKLSVMKMMQPTNDNSQSGKYRQIMSFDNFSSESGESLSAIGK